MPGGWVEAVVVPELHTYSMAEDTDIRSGRHYAFTVHARMRAPPGSSAFNPT